MLSQKLRVMLTILSLLTLSGWVKIAAQNTKENTDRYEAIMDKIDSLLACNSEACISLGDSLLKDSNLPEYDKVRLSYILSCAKKNRVGETAVDFGYFSKDGSHGNLHNLKTPFVLIYFNDPTCDECAILKRELAQSEIINDKIDDGSLTLLSLCVVGKTKEWISQILPENWIDACDENLIVADDDLYYLPSLPALYLLDNNSKVLLKHANIVQIEEKISN